MDFYFRYCVGLLIGITGLFVIGTNAACTFPSYMTGTWFDNVFEEVEFLSSSVLYFKTYRITRGSPSNLTCQSSTGDTYIVRTIDTVSTTISGVSGNYHYYLCMKITQLTSYSFYYYLLADPNSNFERIIAKLDGTSVTASDVCNTGIPTNSPESFHSMVRKDFESSAVYQCADPLLGNFMYTMTDTLGHTSTGNITGCSDIKTANATDTGQTIKVAFSNDGYFGCLANIQLGSTYYVSLFNFDEAPSRVINPRFACAVVEYDGTNVTVTHRARACNSGQTSTDTPIKDSIWPETSPNTIGGVLYLSPFITCIPPTASESDSSSAGVVAAVVVILLLLIAAVVGGFLFWKFYWKPKKEREAKLLEEQKKPRSHIGMMKSAVHAGYGGGIRGDKNTIINMVDIEEEGVEGSVTGHHPNTFKEQNNNLSDKAKRTSAPATPSEVEPEISDPNSIPEKPLLKEKTKLTTGFAADMKGTTTTDTPQNAAEQNGIVLNGSVPKDNVKPQPNVAETARTTNVVSNGNINPIQREPSMNVSKKPIEPQNKIKDRPPSDRKTTVATVSPFMEEKPVVETATKQTSEKREEKLRKSVTFAGDKQVPEPDPITLPREPSNLLGPRDTTLPEIDLKGNDMKGF